MKAVAVIPGQKNSVHLRDVPTSKVSDVAIGRGVLVKVLRVGVDGTDREINDANYGAAPPGDDYLVIGHESFGVVVEVGEKVTEFHAGDYVVATVRRPGHSIYDQIGMYDMTTDDVYYERGINLRHGYLAEYYVDEPEYIVKVPRAIRDTAVLLEPMSIAEKGIAQAYEIQRRLKVWRPRRAAVMGSGTLGLLATMMLRLRGLEVVTFGRTPPPYLNSDLVGELGAQYINTTESPIGAHGPFDLIFEATGSSAVVFEAANVVAKNGVLILSSVTAGNRTVEIPADKLNLDFVLGNKVMFGTVNANRDYFEIGVRDLTQCLATYPGWPQKLLTHPVEGLENYAEIIRLLTSGQGVIKAYCNVASE
jgi:threonine dehydrogenase-like Zn-dependent dehydrogenase